MFPPLDLGNKIGQDYGDKINPDLHPYSCSSEGIKLDQRPRPADFFLSRADLVDQVFSLQLVDDP